MGEAREGTDRRNNRVARVRSRRIGDKRAGRIGGGDVLGIVRAGQGF